MLPALAPYILTQTALAAPVFVLGEILLSFLGLGLRGRRGELGVNAPQPDRPARADEFWWNLAPLFFVFAALLCLNVLSNRYQVE